MMMFKRALFYVVGYLIVYCMAVPAAAQIGRDPFQSPASPAAAAPGFTPQARSAAYQLIGVVMSTEQAVAIFRRPQHEQLMMRRIGERINGRLIKHIRLDGVVYSQE